MSDDDELAPDLPAVPGRGLRPTAPFPWTPEIEAEICERIARGEPLLQIGRLPHMPSIETVTRYAKRNPHFDVMLKEARHESIAAIEAETFDIVDDGRNDWEEREGKNGNTYIALNAEAIARSKLRYEQRKWWLSLISPAHRERQTIDQNVRGVIANVQITDKERAAKALELLRAMEALPDGDDVA